MPKFFFHLYDDTLVLDEQGFDLASSAAAELYAVKTAREIACAEVLEGHLGLNHRIEVEDINGGEVATVHFKDVIKVHP